MIAQPLITVEIDYERLGDAIAKHLAPLAPAPENPIEAYWSTQEIGYALGIKSRKTVYDVVNKSGFPEARYFTKERRWKSTEVLMWAERQKNQFRRTKTEKPKAS